MAEIFRLVAILVIISVALISTSLITIRMTGSLVSNTSGGTTLMIWDQTDSYYDGPQNKFTYPTNSKDYTGCLDWKTSSYYNVYFYANYTNSTGDSITDSDGDCDIRFNETGSWDGPYDMTYNGSSGLWQYNNSFTNKGSLEFEVNCTSSTYVDIILKDAFVITNSKPCIINRQWPEGPLPNLTCNEDENCYYYLNTDSIDDDQNDGITYDHASSGWDDEYHTLSAGGTFTAFIDDDNDPTYFNVTFIITDNDGQSDTAYMLINENLVNDAPQFDTLPDGATEDTPFSDTITATDEENDMPFNFTINITGCTKESWIKGPQASNCTLFEWNQTSDTSVDILSFTPKNNQVGNYTVNYTVRDSGNTTQPYNATYSEVKTFTVSNVNDPPNFTLSNYSVTLWQNDPLLLTANGTDIENDSLVFNTTTLVWNDSIPGYQLHENSSLFPIKTNLTGYPENGSALGMINFTLTNSHVGNYTINITLTDNGTTGGAQDFRAVYTLVNFTIYNVNDPPALENITDNLTGVQSEPLYYYFNASDPDLLTVYANEENLTFNFSFIWCNTTGTGGNNCNSFEQNSTFKITKLSNTTAMLYILATRNDTGNYTMNLTVTDTGGLVNGTLINLTIIPDWAPEIHVPSSLEMTQNQSFVFDFNITDAENDTLIITNRTLYRNLTEMPLDLFPVIIDNSTYPPLYNLTMNYTPVTNDQVGNYTLEINATDVWNRTTTMLINLTVWNVNDPPQITNFTSCYNESDMYGLNLTIYENTQNCFKLYKPDLDLLTPYKSQENLTYNFTLISCNVGKDIPPWVNCSANLLMFEVDEIGTLNFTATNESWRGNYTYNLTIKDSSNTSASKLINITIHAVNDQPVFVNLPDNLNATETVNFYMQVNATDEENNTPFYYNVTFIEPCQQLNGTDCKIFTINSTTGVINFTPDYNDVGNYSINFTVRDSGNMTKPYNATGWQLVNFSVLEVNHIPTINTFRCYNLNCTMNEGGTKIFEYTIKDLDNDTLTCYLYLDRGESTEALVSTKVDCNHTTTYGYLNYVLNTYDEALNYSLANRTATMVVSDGQASTESASINVSIININRAPKFGPDIQSPLSWKSTSSITVINLSNHFEDDYGEVLEYSQYIYAQHVDVVIASDGMVTLDSKGWYGTDMISFIANDTGGPGSPDEALTNTSNNVTLIVEYQKPETRPVTSYEYRPRVASLQIIVPEIITVEMGKSSRAKVILYNDGKYDLYTINLSASTNESNITLQLYDTSFKTLKIGENVSTWLNITMGELDVNKTYLVQLFADVEIPRIGETATITIKVPPTNKTKLEIEIVMVKDMFEENPECMELYGLIVDAEKSLKEGDVAEARRLTKLAIENCQDMIDYAKLQRNQTGAGQPSIIGQLILNPFFIMGFVVAILALAMFGYWLMMKRQPAPEKSKPGK